MLRHVRNPSAPSPKEVWQCLQQHQAEIPKCLEAQRQRTKSMSQTPNAQVKQHELSSHDNKECSFINCLFLECDFHDLHIRPHISHPPHFTNGGGVLGMSFCGGVLRSGLTNLPEGSFDGSPMNQAVIGVLSETSWHSIPGQTPKPYVCALTCRRRGHACAFQQWRCSTVDHWLLSGR